MSMDEITKKLFNKSIKKEWLTKPVEKTGKKRVNLLGLFWLEFGFRNITSIEKFHGDIWTMNDYYRPLKWLQNVHTVFELHPLEHLKRLNKQPDRQTYSGNYIEIFKTEVKQIIVADPALAEFFQRDVVLLDYKNMHNKYSDLNFAGTLDYMIIQAAEMGYEEIFIFGVFMQNDHHRKHIQSLLKTIQKARALGIDIVFDWEDELKDFKCNETLKERYMDLFYK